MVVKTRLTERVGTWMRHGRRQLSSLIDGRGFYFGVTDDLVARWRLRLVRGHAGPASRERSERGMFHTVLRASLCR